MMTVWLGEEFGISSEFFNSSLSQLIRVREWFCLFAIVQLEFRYQASAFEWFD